VDQSLKLLYTRLSNEIEAYMIKFESSDSRKESEAATAEGHRETTKQSTSSLLMKQTKKITTMDSFL